MTDYIVHLLNSNGETGDCIYVFYPTLADATRAGMDEIETHTRYRAAHGETQFDGWAHTFEVYDSEDNLVYSSATN
jgi:hypothetical protein